MLFLLLVHFTTAIVLLPDAYCGDSVPSYPVPSYDGLTVKHVSVITRHGDRSPSCTCWIDGPTWDCEDFGNFGLPQVNQGKNRIIDIHFNRNVVPGNCETGQLTKHGYQQHISNGDYLRNTYINNLHLLSNHFIPSNFLIRSTNFQRTLFSAQGLMEGLYPINNSVPNCIESILDIYTGDASQENMYTNSAFCPVLKNIASTIDQSPEVINFKQLVNAPLLNQLSEIFGWSPQKSIDEIYDCFHTHVCHQLNFPDAMTQDLFEQVKSNYLWLQKALYMSQYNNYTFAEISISSFLKDFISLLISVNQNSSPVKFALYSGHDTTILPFLITYKIWDSEWPPYASLVQVELLQNQNSDYFIRVFYNRQEMLLPDCEYQSPCPFETFAKITHGFLRATTFCNK